MLLFRNFSSISFNRSYSWNMREGRRRKLKGGETTELLRRPHFRKDAVNRETWLRYLEVFLTDVNNSLRMNGIKITDSHVRAVYRWRREGATPTIWVVDEFLVTYDMTLSDFEIWCLTEGRKIWPREAPDWWDA